VSIAHNDPILAQQLEDIAALDDPAWGPPESWPAWTDAFTWEPGPDPYSRFLDQLERLDSLRREEDARYEADMYRRYGV
jgi:hypothetical protein